MEYSVIEKIKTNRIEREKILKKVTINDCRKQTS